MVAELVRQHAAELVARQGVDGVRGDHDQVPTTGERVQLVDREHGDHEPPVRQPVGLQHRSPGDIERGSLAPRGTACAEQRRQDDDLHRSEEEQQHGGEVPECECHEGDMPDHAQWQPHDSERQEPERDDGNDRQERRHRRTVDPAPCAGHRSSSRISTTIRRRSAWPYLHWEWSSLTVRISQALVTVCRYPRVHADVAYASRSHVVRGGPKGWSIVGDVRDISEGRGGER